MYITIIFPEFRNSWRCGCSHYLQRIIVLSNTPATLFSQVDVKSEAKVDGRFYWETWWPWAFFFFWTCCSYLCILSCVFFRKLSSNVALPEVEIVWIILKCRQWLSFATPCGQWLTLANMRCHRDQFLEPLLSRFWKCSPVCPSSTPCWAV